MTTNDNTQYIAPPILYNTLWSLSKDEVKKRNGERNLFSAKISKQNYQNEQFLKPSYFLRNNTRPSQDEDYKKIQNGQINDANFAVYSIVNELIITDSNKKEYTCLIGACDICGWCYESKVYISSSGSIQISHKNPGYGNGQTCKRKIKANQFIIMNYDSWKHPDRYLSEQELGRLRLNKIPIRYEKAKKNHKKRSHSEIGIGDAEESKYNDNNTNNKNELIKEPMRKKPKLNPASSNQNAIKPGLKKQVTGTVSCDSDFEEEEYNETDKEIDNFLNRLIFIDNIGGGNSGRVYCVYDCNNEELLAAKVIPKKVCHKTMMDPTYNEVAVLEKLGDTQNTVNLVRYLEYRDNHHIFMKKMDYDLQSFLKSNKQMDDSDRLATFEKTAASIGDALVKIDELGFNHCDVKPSNILMDFQCHSIKLADFGSTIKHGLFPINTTPGYYPEHETVDSQIVDKDFKKSAIDVYCYGMSLFTILVPERSPLIFMAEINKQEKLGMEWKSALILAKQTEAYIYCDMEWQKRGWRKEPIVFIKKCLNPHHSSRIGLHEIMKLDYYQQCKSNTSPIPSPSHFKRKNILQIAANVHKYPSYLSGIKNNGI